MITQFGTHEGREVREAVLEDGETRVSILNYGCVTRDWRVRGVPCVLGFDRFDDYPLHSRSFGIIAGRVANRTAFGRFGMAGETYQLAVKEPGDHHLHGGVLGLGRRLWEMEADGDKAVRLAYHSPDGEEGYPGAVDFTVDIRLEGHALAYEMRGEPDRVTPINLAQHNYYNLDGGGDVLDHRLRLAASRYTPTDATLIPTGEIAPVDGHHFDFRSGETIGALDPDRTGTDLNLVLDAPGEVATLTGRDLTLTLSTDQPGVQVFNAPAMDVPVPGLDGIRYGPFAGVCLEAQHFPDALNQPSFPSILRSPDDPYIQNLRVEIR